jgi:hypothetical protein
MIMLAASTVLPVDFSSLESSSKDFFDRIDHMGEKLSANHANLLYGAVMLFASVALRPPMRSGGRFCPMKVARR